MDSMIAEKPPSSMTTADTNLRKHVAEETAAGNNFGKEQNLDCPEGQFPNMKKKKSLSKFLFR
jgi:hypothetical protein